MNRNLLAGTVLSLGLAVVSASALFAAIPNQTPEQLQKNADLIVVGTVQEIHAQRTTDELWDRQTGTVLFLVEQVEKGDKIGPGDQMNIGFWTTDWVGPEGQQPPHGNGHYLPKPDPKAKVRVFVQIKEGGSYEAALPNGFAPLAAKKPSK
jgi:hypothetical protein